ncbi:hypothetical protein TWF730_010675 [Orbilia blumenaviensis]|uniref:Uncharacterized protein n=1 Tax=Orbilia blumenaviensis TaxID=1796055 RepID=A0AAV9USM0_9PEZI
MFGTAHPQYDAPRAGTPDWAANTLGAGQFGQSNRKRSARYADSDQEEDDDVLIPLGTKKARTSSIDTNQTSSFLPSHPSVSTDAFISPPVTPTPMPHRQASDIAMEDLDMMDSQLDSSQQEWNLGLHIGANNQVPSYVQQDSNLSMLDTEEHQHQHQHQHQQGSHILRPHTPGIIMRDMTRLEVSPSSELQSRGWMGMEIIRAAEPTQYHHHLEQHRNQDHHHQQQQQHSGAGGSGTAASKSRFTMGYRADCEKCRNRVPGHYAHPPSF